MSSPTIEKGEIPALLERWSREARKELDVRAPSLSSLPSRKKKTNLPSPHRMIKIPSINQ
jgi:hypothetical protein